MAADTTRVPEVRKVSTIAHTKMEPTSSTRLLAEWDTKFGMANASVLLNIWVNEYKDIFGAAIQNDHSLFWEDSYMTFSHLIG